ncbi:MAG: 4Fe-4S ferredoxin, partial [Calditrichaeota bacterium]|nr:4Fe-4S ferredoxin [Calditrichota bacterium]
VEAAEFERRVAEHALGAVVALQGKIGFFSFVINVTKDCDCFGQRMRPVIPDVGILASYDPVAIDTAALDLVLEKTGRELADFAYPHIRGREQLSHGEKIGLGTRRYRLHVVD